MWSERKFLFSGVAATLAVAIAPVSTAYAKHVRMSGKASYKVSSQKDRPASHASRHQRDAVPRNRFVGPALNYHPNRYAGRRQFLLDNSTLGYYPPYGYPFTSRSSGSRRATVGYYTNPYVQYSTSPFTGYYGWYGQLSP